MKTSETIISTSTSVEEYSTAPVMDWNTFLIYDNEMDGKDNQEADVIVIDCDNNPLS